MRALGDRLESTADARAIEAALAITLLAPMVPMLLSVSAGRMVDRTGPRRPILLDTNIAGRIGLRRNLQPQIGRVQE